MSAASPNLAGLIRQFNLAPASYVDASWLPPEWCARYAAVSLHSRTAAALSRWLLQQHGLADQFDFDFAAREKRLALIDTPVLRALARYLGVACYAPFLRRVVTREARRALVRRIGDPAYTFLLGAALPTRIRTPAPLDPDATDFDVKLISTGSKALLAALPNCTPALCGRVQFKLPRDAGHSVPRPAAPAEVESLRTLLFDRLLPDFAPQWLWLF